MRNKIDLNKINSKLLEQHNNYKQDSKRAVPVMAMTFDGKKFSNFKWNLSQNNNEPVEETHAESLLLKSLSKSLKKPLDLIITLDPCDDCLPIVLKDKRINNIYFIFKKGWKKTDSLTDKELTKSNTKIFWINFPKSSNKKDWSGVLKWKKSTLKHLNSTQMIKQKGKLKVGSDNLFIWK